MVISQQHLSAVLVLALCVAAADAAGGATVEHSLDGGHSFSTAGRIHLQDRVTDADSAAVSGVFERQALSSSTLQQLEQLVEADRWGYGSFLPLLCMLFSVHIAMPLACSRCCFPATNT
jgi:hypothetical protein